MMAFNRVAIPIAVLLAVASGMALATEKETAGAPPDVSAPSESTTSYGAWSVKCGTGQSPDRVTRLCVLTQDGYDENRRLVFHVEIGKPPSAINPVFAIQFPVNVRAREKLSIQFESGVPEQTVNLDACFGASCYADLAFTNDLGERIARLPPQTKVTLAFKNAQNQPSKLPISLVGFTAAWRDYIGQSTTPK